MEKIRLSLIELLLLATMCGKIYFLFGFSAGTHLPQAPALIIAIREVTLLSLIVALSYFSGVQNFLSLSKTSIVRLFLLLFMLGLAVSLIHILQAKETLTILQHYLRNNILVSIVFPLSFLFFSQNKYFSFRKVVLIFAIINVATSIFQLFFLRNLMWVTRPTGLIGDPLINSSFILISFFFLIQKQIDFSKKIITYAFITTSIFILYAASSISALFAWGAAMAVSSYVKHRRPTEFKKGKTNWLDKVKTLTICFFLFLAIYQTPIIRNNLQIDTQIEQKIHSIISFFYCKENCDQPHGSITGRMLSYRMGLDHCGKGVLQCLAGDYLSPEYSRLDATWSSLLINWGLVYAVLYYFIFFILPLKKIFTIKSWTMELQFACFVFFFYWAFSIFNCVFYKYPLNVLFYMCTAQLLANTTYFETLKSTNPRPKQE